jgi:hypothetical protein
MIYCGNGSGLIIIKNDKTYQNDNHSIKMIVQFNGVNPTLSS